ncbi:MAG TPA: MFS transporter [Candidatus Acidoferrales bacterium]|nr:MFS transporter [Candidatus Acidoferrales bacterium]
MPAPRLYPRTGLVLLTALNLLNYIDRSVLFAVQPMVQEEFHRPDADFGLLSSAFFVVYMLAAPLVGPLADRFRRKPILIVGTLLWSAATMLTAATHSFTALFIRHALVGIGEATFVTISPTWVADLFPQEKRGRIFGVYYVALPLGTALGYLLGGLLAPRYGWRVPFYLGGAPGLLLGFALMFFSEPKRGSQEAYVAPEPGSVFGLVRNFAFLTVTLGMASMTFALGGLQVWMPTFLHRMRGYSLERANLVFGGITAINGTAASLVGGWLGDLWLRRTKGSYYLVSAAGMAIAVPVMIVAIYSRGPAMLPAILIAGFLLLINTSPLNAALINAVSPGIRATAIAWNILTIHLLGDALSPWLIGFISDRQSLEGGFGSAIIAIAIASIVLFYGMRFAPPAPVNPPAQG